MADLTNTGLTSAPAKEQRALWPPHSIEGDWARLEPLLTAADLRAKFLFGISLASNVPDETGRFQVMTEPLLNDIIQRAVEIAESDTGLTIMSTAVDELLPFDRLAFESHGYFQVTRRPVWAVKTLTIRTADNQDVYFVPLNWVTTGAMYRGQINIIPLTLAFATTGISPGPATGIAGAAFLASLGYYQWIASYWGINYMVGFPDNMIPRLVNELIGAIAASEVLSMLAATHAKVTSTSTAVDGFSESLGLTGPMIYRTRLEELTEKRRRAISKLKTVFGTKWSWGVF